MEKILDEWVIWSVAPESIIQESVRVAPKALSPIELGNSPKYAKE